MKAWIFSDLHLEFRRDFRISSIPAADVCICAGDLMAGGIEKSIRWLGDHVLPSMPIVFVPGNCEYRGHSLHEGAAVARRIAAEYSGLHLLIDDTVAINGVRFLGTTLWSDFALFGEPRLAIEASAHLLKDFREIKTSLKPLRRFSPRQSAALNRDARLFLNRHLSENSELPVVVVSHHAPSVLSIRPDLLDEVTAPSYASSLERTILRYAPHLWIHGHIHLRSDYLIGRTRVICNPLGRPGEQCDFEERMVVDVSLSVPVSPGILSK